MKNNASLLYNVSLVVGDFLSLVLAFVGAYILRVSLGLSFGSSAVSHPVHARTYLGIFLLLVPFWILIFALFGLYSSKIYEKRFVEAGRLFMASFVGLLFVIGYAFFVNETIFPAKLVPVYGFVLAFLFLLLFRNLARYIRSLLFRYDIGITNLLIVGNTRVSGELVASLHNSHLSGYQIVGVVGSGEHIPPNIHPKLFETFDEALAKIGGNNIHAIVQTELYAASEKNNEILTKSQENHIAFRFVPGNTELFVGNIQVELFRSAIPVLAVHQTALIGWGRIVKRLFDLIVTIPLLIIAAPFMALITLTIAIFGGRGGIFFRQTRLTRFSQPFKVFKFRTAKAKYNGLSHEQAFAKLGKPELLKKFYENGEYLPHDPRYTKVGLFLRKTSLDELPQMFNVIKGDLSLVGPRALVPNELEAYAKKHTILSVKSGITGLAQVSGRKSIRFDERRQLDMYYVQNWSFWLDIVILIKTIKTILTGEGAQ